MDTASEAPRVNVLGYAAGVGLAFTAVVGSLLHFAFVDASTPLMLLGTFVVGAALGGAWAARRKPSLTDDD